ncbi:MAG: hypothetical protein E7591_06400 [Ruminococcaceae bacterium]|nr:hypothetical protein [Oscillospiraceae bacterium]MBE6965054.1 hypothetical protein [Oscillospiraceae bacterium]
MLKKIYESDKFLSNVLAGLIAIILVISFILFLIFAISEGFAVGASILGSGIGLSIGLFIDYYIAGCFGLVAEDKGYDASFFIRFSFIFTMIGYILVAALPDRGDNEPNE